MRVGLLGWLEDWFASRCDGEWEHQNGIRIDTLDNPGWCVTADVGTPVANREMAFDGDETWLDCRVSDGVFTGCGDPSQLGRIIEILQEWTGPVGHT